MHTQEEIDAFYRQGGAFVKQLRESSNITLEQLADKVQEPLERQGLGKIDAFLLRYVESGEIPPDPLLVKEISKALGERCSTLLRAFGYRKITCATKNGTAVELYLSPCTTKREEIEYVKKVEAHEGDVNPID